MRAPNDLDDHGHLVHGTAIATSTSNVCHMLGPYELSKGINDMTTSKATHHVDKLATFLLRTLGNRSAQAFGSPLAVISPERFGTWGWNQQRQTCRSSGAFCADMGSYKLEG